MALSMFTETPCVFTIEENTGPYTIPCEVVPEKFLHINAWLSENQQAQLLEVLKKQAGEFAWEYPVEFMVIESKDPSKGHPIIL